MIPRGCRSLLGTVMWTPATRRQHSRDHLRYETDLTDAEWALIEPLPAGTEAMRATSGVALEGSSQRDFLRAAGRCGVAAPANRSASEDDRVSLVRALA